VVPVLARREAEKSVGNLELINLRPRRLPQRVRAKRAVQGKEDRVPTGGLVVSQKPGRHLRLSKDLGNPNAEGKKERERHRRAVHNNLVIIAVPEQKSGVATSVVPTPRCDVRTA